MDNKNEPHCVNLVMEIVEQDIIMLLGANSLWNGDAILDIGKLTMSLSKLFKDTQFPLVFSDSGHFTMYFFILSKGEGYEAASPSQCCLDLRLRLTPDQLCQLNLKMWLQESFSQENLNPRGREILSTRKTNSTIYLDTLTRTNLKSSSETLADTMKMWKLNAQNSL